MTPVDVPKNPKEVPARDGHSGAVSNPYSYANLDTHPCFLNVVFLEASPDKIVPVAKDALERISRIRETRVRDTGIPWHRDVRALRRTELEPFHYRYHYKPRGFVVAGTFDAAALFLSPSLELSSWMQGKELLVAGQDINMGLLPTLSALLPTDEEKAAEPDCPTTDQLGEDFNLGFIEEYAKNSWTDGQFLPAASGFISITKLKLSPLVLWPVAEPDAKSEQGRIKAILRRLWAQIQDWRRSTKIGPDDDPPHAALALAYGWNEVLVVAHADSPGKLLRLSLLLRRPMMTIAVDDLEKESFNGKDQGHLAATSLTALGHDFEIRRRASQALKDGGDNGEKPVAAESLLELTKTASCDKRVQDLDPGDEPIARGDIEGLFFQIGCHTYPGHEDRLIRRLREFETAVENEGLLRLAASDGTDRTSIFIDIGKRDVWTPKVKIGQGGLPPRQAMALIGLLSIWMRNGGTGPGEGGGFPPGQIPDAFDFFTRIATTADALESVGIDSFEEKTHVGGLFFPYLSKEAFNKALGLAGASSGDPEFAGKIRLAMRTLQLPYSLSEQILHVVNMLLWANAREIIWDESVELMPPVLALASYLEGRESWWRREVARLSSLHPRITPQFKDLFQDQIDEVRQRLEEHPDTELVSLSQAFRTHFYNVHFSSYLTGEMPDLNLRYKGSVHQLLRIANMILDALTDVVLGPRACMAIIGDRISPQVDMPCHVTVVQLNSAAFTMPIMLETLAHEVAHQFMSELARDSKDSADNTARAGDEGDSSWRDHAWVRIGNYPPARQRTFKSTKYAFHVLDQQVFGARLQDEDEDDAGLFIESAADYLELRLLQYDFEHWLRSYMLRASLAARPSSIEVIGKLDENKRLRRIHRDRAIGVPAADHSALGSAVMRIVLVYIATRLVEALDNSDSFDPDGFKSSLMKGTEPGGAEGPRPALPELHTWLRKECLLGPASSVQDKIRDIEAWNQWIEENVVNPQPWLADRFAVSAAAFFFKCLDEHAAEAEDSTSENTGRLWSSIRDSFRQLWMDPVAAPEGELYPESPQPNLRVVDHLLPALFIRQWITLEEREALRKSSRKGRNQWREDHFRPWVAEVQPLETELILEAKRKDLDPKDELAPDEKISVRTHIYQRGSIKPADPLARWVWESATRRFLTRMLLMVPAWHRAILYKIQDVVSRDEQA